MPTIQWFPGHMARARRILAENIALIDVVVELADARIPISSRNPEIDRILGAKPRVLVCNKADLADPQTIPFWKEAYRKQEIRCVYTDCKKGEGVKAVTQEIMRTMQSKIQRAMDKGRKKPTIRTMIVGIPNVGKSSFINRMAGKAVAVTGDKPGVTRNKQWLKIHPQIDLLDTPGLLWPKIENQVSAYKLACTGAMKDDILDEEDIASFLLQFLLHYYPDALTERYRLDLTAYREDIKIAVQDEKNAAENMEESEKQQAFAEQLLARKKDIGRRALGLCGQKRGCILRGGEVDFHRIAGLVLDDFRAGKLGRVTLDRPEDLYRVAESAISSGEETALNGEEGMGQS